MDNLSLIKVEKKLNKRHLALFILCILLVILLTIVVCRKINIAILKYAEEQSAKVLTQTQDNAIMNNEIIEEAEKQKEIDKYKALSAEDIDKTSKIYAHSDVKRVFLTFDDGPTKQVTPYILDELKKENIKANFFVLGYKVEINPELVKQEYSLGHFIGNHGYSHRYSQVYASVDSVLDEYNKTQQIIRNAIGNQNYNSLIFRFPGGTSGGPYNDLKLEASEKLKAQGVSNIDWNALTNDADGANTKEQIMDNFYRTVQGKSSVVLLMHDAADKILTYETLPDIINYFKQNGYEFETIYDLLGRE